MNAADHTAGLREGRCGIGPIELIPLEHLTIGIAAEAKGFKGEDHFTRSEIAMCDRVTQMALVAAAEAVSQSGIEFAEALATRTATIIGTSMGGQHTQDDNYRLVYAEGKTRVHPFIVPRLMANAPVSWISMTHGLKGPAYSISTACASSNHAIGQAFHLIRSGGADAAVTGGAESGLTYGVLKAWEGLRVMSKTACRPFSKTRDGMVQGEGAAILVLEELEAAKARGATILGEIIGFGSSADAGDIVQPSLDGATRAMRGALSDAFMPPEKVAYVNAHGTATAMNDRTECEALRDVFGPHADALAVSSTKSAHGHCIGAAGALEMVATLSALQGIVPPTIGYEEPDPDCDLDVVPNEAREKDVAVAMSNSFAFGGLNAVLVVKRFDG
ncbi:UNVERIFIED_CONTAM: hypothetical protein GTU68_062219 [Idotea baltica]|nr:hypothetical protein [Idotea baltica]